MVFRLLTIFAVGIAILGVALALNYLAGKLSISTWYDFVKNPGGTSVISYIWLFVIYPFCLGLTAYAAAKLLDV